MSHLWPKISPLIDDDKDVPTAHQLPIAVLPVPVTVPVRVPVSVIPIGIGVDRRAIVRMDGSPVGIAGMICTIGAANGRATASVNGSAITGLDCRAIAVVSYFSVFPLITPSRRHTGCTAIAPRMALTDRFNSLFFQGSQLPINIFGDPEKCVS
jgi:hypothetical protein